MVERPFRQGPAGQIFWGFAGRRAQCEMTGGNWGRIHEADSDLTSDLVEDAMGCHGGAMGSGPVWYLWCLEDARRLRPKHCFIFLGSLIVIFVSKLRPTYAVWLGYALRLGLLRPGCDAASADRGESFEQTPQPRDAEASANLYHLKATKLWGWKPKQTWKIKYYIQDV